MARLSSANPPPPPDTTPVNLNRMLARLQQILINPDTETESRLRTLSSERTKVETNIDHARSLLMRLEQDSLTIKLQTKKQETQSDLLRKRELLRRLAERLQEYNELADHEPDDSDSDSSEGEDLLGEDTPSEATSSHASISHADPDSTTPSPTRGSSDSQSQATNLPSPSQPLFQPPTTTASASPTPTPEPSSTLRNRADRTELFSTTSPTATTTGISLTTSEALQSHNRHEQELLTSSLLNLAVSLKQSSRAFGASLEEEKSVLENATKGMDKNELGLEAATRKMGLLRGFTEGRGWWGRMIMYFWIFGLMVAAILLVFVGPKLRF